MKKNILVKGLTLLGFVLLLSLFILYRMDRLNPSALPSPPANDQLLAKNSLAADTIPPALRDSLLRLLPDSIRRQHMLLSSSKSIVVIKEKSSFLDSVVKRMADSMARRKWMMSSSKSVIIVDPAQKLIDSAPYKRKYKTVKQ